MTTEAEYHNRMAIRVFDPNYFEKVQPEKFLERLLEWRIHNQIIWIAEMNASWYDESLCWIAKARGMENPYPARFANILGWGDATVPILKYMIDNWGRPRKPVLVIDSRLPGNIPQKAISYILELRDQEMIAGIVAGRRVREIICGYYGMTISQCLGAGNPLPPEKA